MVRHAHHERIKSALRRLNQNKLVTLRQLAMNGRLIQRVLRHLITHEARGNQPVYRAEHQRRGGKNGYQIGDTRLWNQPQIHHQHLP
jgi:uncharacterized protein with von Willebrand factor type A (vWA) domain